MKINIAKKKGEREVLREGGVLQEKKTLRESEALTERKTSGKLHILIREKIIESRKT